MMRIAVDTGGTFTDCVYVAEGRVRIRKVASTPHDPGLAVQKGVAALAGATPVDVRHGTTVGTNALLERKGARVAFVTTAGFEDTLAIGRQARTKLYDLFFEEEAPLAARELCFGVAERTVSDGSIVLAPDAQELAELKERIRRSGAEAIAVSLLFSFANPQNERTVATALRELDLPVSVSQEILPEFREYERGSTVVINSYLMPKVASYLASLDGGLASSGSRLQVMQSSGGIVPAALAGREPVRTILSGPAGGVVGALAVARQAGFEQVLTFDMGGTSTDVSLVDGRSGLSVTTEARVRGMPVAVPMLRIHTVGAGGGSLAGFDRGGALEVGPESAGADPGPICYGRGERPTVTDANLLLGRLIADSFLGGEMHLDEARARDFVDRAKGSLADVETFAEGIVRLVDTHMERALRHISVEAGHDPRAATLVSFGGAGPLHAGALARALRIPKVLVPRFPGGLSAYGILVSDVVRDASRTVMLAPDDEAIEGHFVELEEGVRREMEAQGLMGVAHRMADLRYAGQGYEITVEGGGDLAAKFHDAHQMRYGYSDRKRTVELVNVRLRLIAATEPVEQERLEPKLGGVQRALVKRSRMYCDRGWKEGSVYDRELLGAGDVLAGPAVIVEYSATTFLPAGMRARVDEWGNLLIETGVER